MSAQHSAGGTSQQLRSLDRDRLVFLDFVGSGPDCDSWPIEIGTARVRLDGSVRVHSTSIRPHPSWQEGQWSTASEQEHGIARERLDSAPSTDIVAVEFLELTSGMTLVSNAPDLDRRCLEMLVATISSTDTFDILGWNAAIAPFGFAGIRRAHAFLKELPPSHRAGDDAARLAMAWLAASEGDG
jgi:hypothetical protein